MNNIIIDNKNLAQIRNFPIKTVNKQFEKKINEFIIGFFEYYDILYEIELIDEIGSRESKIIYNIGDKRYYFKVMNDTNNEPNNKRIQDPHFTFAKNNNCSLVGIYPLSNEKLFFLKKAVYCVWDNIEFDKYRNEGNPSVKVNVESILTVLKDEYLVGISNKLKYHCQVYNSNMFSKLLLEVDAKVNSDSEKYRYFNNNRLDKGRTTLNKNLIDIMIELKGKSRNQKLQNIFRNNLIMDRKKCELCGIKDKRLLVASHIKPVAHIVDDESINDINKLKEIISKNNGLLLCVIHDALFDKGIITIGIDGVIIKGESFKPLSRFIYLPNKINVSNEQKNYILYHNEYIFLG